MTVNDEETGLQCLQKIKSVEAPQWMIPYESRSELARAGAKELFSILKPYAPKSPFEKLLVDGFDAEQIWKQIDLQSQPVLSTLRMEVKRYVRNPEEFVKLFGKEVRGGSVKDSEFDDVDENMRELDDDDDVEEEDEEQSAGEESETESEDEEEDRDEDVEENVGNKGVFEDEFLKLDELEEYLEKDEDREYGIDAAGKKKKKNSKKGKRDEEPSEDEDDEIDLFEGGVNEEDNEAGELMYGDFFGYDKKKEVKRNSDLIDRLEDSMTDSEEEDTEGDEDDEGDEGMENEKLSTYQKEELKCKGQIKEIEKRMLEPKTWALQGEVTAAQRPKNSALEADLEYDHNVRPAPVITEEFTFSLEEMIKKRILEGRLDDVQKPRSAPTKGPRERKELDETKSKKGLGEIYEDAYVKNANPDAAPLTFSDELKNETSMIFKKLCVKLDALSHFHFAPKPVIEDMSLPENLSALVMEEVAPIAVSEAAMLAPEEVYDGKGDFKEETELTQAERKMRRANKKRKFKAVAAKHAPKRLKENTVSDPDGKEAF